jgi:hypothetical protein
MDLTRRQRERIVAALRHDAGHMRTLAASIDGGEAFQPGSQRSERAWSLREEAHACIELSHTIESEK